MTNAEIIEEILFEADAYGLRQEVINAAKELRRADPTMEVLTSFELAFNEWIK